MEISDAERLKAREMKNRKLKKKLLAKDVMDDATLKEVLRNDF